MDSDPKMSSFTDLIVWKEGHNLVLLVYKQTKSFPNDEKFGLANQVQRAVVSITSNIAEGFNRQGLKEKIQFYSIARGSLAETHNQIIIAKDLGYISDDNFAIIIKQIHMVGKLLNGLIRKMKGL